MHCSTYQNRSALVISARPASESAYLAGTLAKYLPPNAMQPSTYQNDSAAVSRSLPAMAAIDLRIPRQDGIPAP
jgi:hypothetical protein